MRRSIGMKRVLVLLALVGCTRVDEAAVRRDPASAPPPAELYPVVITPSLPALEQGMMDHADVFGWSRDGAVFGFCQTDGGMGARHCTLHSSSGAESLDDVDPATHEIDPAKTAAIAARMKDLALGPTAPKWRHQVEVVWKTSDADLMHSAPGAPVLHVGVRAPGKEAVYPITLAGLPGIHGSVHPEIIAVSPDGTMLGVVAHAYGGEFTDRLMVKVMPISKVLAAAE